MNAALQTRQAPAPFQTGPTVSVVHLVLSLNIGGLEQVVYDLVRCFDRQKFSMRIVCLGETGEWGTRFEALGVAVEPLSVLGQGKVGRIMTLARRLRELQPDVVHTHNPAPHFVGAIAARLSRVPVVIHTKHGRNYPDVGRRVLVNRLASWLTTRIVAVSRDAADVAEQIEKVPRRKVEVIRNGIDLARCSFVERRAQGASPRAIHVARLSDAAKDQRTLLRAVRIVADAEPDFVIDIVGDGADRADLESYCDELMLRRHVNFLGFRDDVPALLSQAAFFVLSSVTEGISLTLLEAAASGLPIVATDVGGNSEVVADGTTGRLVPPRAPEKLAAAMLAMLRDREGACRMGQAGRKRIEEQFNLGRTVARYEEIYETSLRSNRGRRSQVVSRRGSGLRHDGSESESGTTR